MIKGIDYPEWMSQMGIDTVSKGYLQENENVFEAYDRIARTASRQLGKPELTKFFKEALEKNWLCPASPVFSNLGTDRGLPISCFGMDVNDSIFDIAMGSVELMMMTKSGGGVGIGLNRIRGRGKGITGNGQSEGIVPWAKRYDSDIISTNQGSVRRGAASVNLNIEHLDIDEFIRIRRPEGDPNRQCLNLHHAVQVTDRWMESMLSGDEEKRELWKEILKSRVETGEPYLHFIDTTNDNRPDSYKNFGLEVSMTNICSEITLYTDKDHSFVCCLSSLNLSRYEEWAEYKFENGMTLPELSTWFLEGVITEFVLKAEKIKGLEKAVLSAIKGGALGLGVLGWHSFLQKKKLPFNSLVSSAYNKKIFKFIDEESEKASRNMAAVYGEREWTFGTGLRNTHRMALAPTYSNSIISNASAGIEPMRANAYNMKSAKGTFLYKNPYLVEVLDELNKNETEVWKDIVLNGGSVQHLKFLTDEQKEVFLTFEEINMHGLVEAAGERQKYIDQTQSLNLCFPANADPKYIHEVHINAWESGVETLYYLRTESVLKADNGSRGHVRQTTKKADDDCSACEG